jgi:drug/metabolite transporter (DMT)-like permease
LLAGLGFIATAGHLLVVHAFRRAPAGLLAPFQYVEIIGATILGLIFFGDFPDALTWLGVFIIVGSGMYVFRREAVLARRATP